MTEDGHRRLSDTDVHALLAKRRRRLVLGALQELSPPLSTGQVAAHVEASLDDDATADARGDVTVSLYHNHLPRLNDYDVIEFDRDDGVLRQGPNFATLAGQLPNENESTEVFAD